MLKIPNAEHEETAPHASTLFISRLTCSLVGQTQAIGLTPGTRVHEVYGTDEAMEQFGLTYGKRLKPISVFGERAP